MEGVRCEVVDAKAGKGEVYVVFAASLGGDRLGYMPLGKGYGFVDVGKHGGDVERLLRTVAHELGHGAFGLEHLDSRYGHLGYAGGGTDNLMEGVGEGAHLSKFQWDNCHDPEVRLPGGRDDDEAESVLAAVSCARDYELGEAALRAVAADAELRASVTAFIAESGCASEAAAYADYALEAIWEDDRYVWARFEELYDIVNGDPGSLVDPCEEHAEVIAAYSDLASLRLSGKALDRISNSDGTWEVQAVEDAAGTVVNLDRFSVRITALPTRGDINTIDDLFYYFRTNINEFARKFTPYDDPYDAELWVSEDPVSTIFQIQMTPVPGAVDGDVICSQYMECCWVFTTLRGPWYASGYHPVSGNRQFGYGVLVDGHLEVYTKGLDRTTTWYHSIGDSRPALAEADELWMQMQRNLVSFVNAHGGQAEIANDASHQVRVDWDKIRGCLQSEKPVYNILCEY